MKHNTINISCKCYGVDLIKVLHIFGKMNRGGAEMRTVEVMPLLAEKGVRFDFAPCPQREVNLTKKSVNCAEKYFLAL